MLNIWIYDIEAFSHDWIVVCKNIKTNEYIDIHNNNYVLKKFIIEEKPLLGGFNNKHYDDWILCTMLNGGSNDDVKRHNDYIIDGGQGWAFPLIQYQPKLFKSFDLRDDTVDPALSLKAIEGNLGKKIIESNVNFNINRKLTKDELEDVVRYCRHDVDSTHDLFTARLDNYLKPKLLIAEMYGLPPDECIGLTNAKLSAKVLGAKRTERSDEREYKIPSNIDINDIPQQVLDFFNLITDKSIPDEKLFGDGKGVKGSTLDIIITTSKGSCPVTYAWGGVHGAKPSIIIESTDTSSIVNMDVASLYPNSMLNFGYCSRSMDNPQAYKDLVTRRLEYKKAGDKLKADALKLIINTTFGAMLNKYNDLYDALMGRSVCISNQLAITMLITRLAKECESIDYININTDGIMFSLDNNEIPMCEEIVKEWSKLTGFEMEREDFKRIIQKDVNNYIGITVDGDLKTKGGFVKGFEGGDFKSNSTTIIDKAVVNCLVYGVPVEQTINNCNDIHEFQMIVKTGGTFEGSYLYVDGERVPLQKVNRIYAVKDKKYGQIVKGKWIRSKRKKNKETGKMEETLVNPPVWQEVTIPDCPENTFIDNENILGISDIDKTYYINIANKRIDKYVNLDCKVKNKINRITEEVVILAEKKTTLNIYQKLNVARSKFLQSNIKKTGVNRYAEFKYFTLDDIIPIKHEIFNELRLIDCISFTDWTATLTLVNLDNPSETIQFTSPLEKDESLIKNPIQKLGAIQTYIRRYLYILLLDIVESDTVDAVSGQDTINNKKPVSQNKRNDYKKELTNVDGAADEIQINALKTVLKKLKDENNDEQVNEYIKTCITKIQNNITKTDAEKMLIEIGEVLTTGNLPF